VKKNKTLILFLILAVFLLCDCIFFLPFQISKFKAAGDQSAVIKGKLETLKRDIKNKDSLMEQQQSLENKLRDIETRFLRKGDAALIISEINRISKEIGLDIANIRPYREQEIDKKGDISFYYLPVDLKFNTGFHKLGEFLNRVEKLDFSLKLRRLEIKGEYPELSVEMQICGIVRE